MRLPRAREQLRSNAWIGALRPRVSGETIHGNELRTVPLHSDPCSFRNHAQIATYTTQPYITLADYSGPATYSTRSVYTHSPRYIRSPSNAITPDAAGYVYLSGLDVAGYLYISFEMSCRRAAGPNAETAAIINSRHACVSVG
jgi:hypothetical protein